MEEKGKSQSNSVYRFILLLLVVIFAFLMLLLTQNKKRQQPNIYVDTDLIAKPTIVDTGSLSLRTLDDSVIGKVNEEINLYIEANSANQAIVGYDIIITFDPAEIEISSAESQLTDFEFFSASGEDNYKVTGWKKLESKEQSVFTNTRILLLKVIPKKAGNILIVLADKLNKEKNQLVDEKTNILTPKVGSITLEIKE